MCNYRFNEKSLSYQKCHIAACNGDLLLSGGNCGEDEFLSKEAVSYRIGAEVMIYCVYARLKKLTNRSLCIKEDIRMKINEYQELAMTTLNPELSKRDVLINSVMGLCGESGEAIDIVKKWMAQGHELDKEHLAKELGDVAWYIAEAATALDISLEDIFQANIDKLKMRYPDGFETKKSLVRLKGDI